MNDLSVVRSRGDSHFAALAATVCDGTHPKLITRSKLHVMFGRFSNGRSGRHVSPIDRFRSAMPIIDSTLERRLLDRGQLPVAVWTARRSLTGSQPIAGCCCCCCPLHGWAAAQNENELRQCYVFCIIVDVLHVGHIGNSTCLSCQVLLKARSLQRKVSLTSSVVT